MNIVCVETMVVGDAAGRIQPDPGVALRQSTHANRGKRRRSVIAILVVGALLSTTASGQSFTKMGKMRDGVHLATTVHLPAGDGPFPVLLYRTPYDDGRNRQWLEFTKFGVAVVTQDVRGRFDSEGKYMVFTQDGDGKLKDGDDTSVSRRLLHHAQPLPQD